VGAQAEKICAKTFAIKWDVAEGLSGIAMQRYTLLSANGREFREWLDDADFVIGQHHTHQLGVFSDGGRKLFGVEETIWLRREKGDAKALALKLLKRIENSMMFADHTDQMAWLSPLACHGSCMSEQGNVVSFCGPAGEDQLFTGTIQAIA
jgi:hypothetical protein